MVTSLVFLCSHWSSCRGELATPSDGVPRPAATGSQAVKTTSATQEEEEEKEDKEAKRMRKERSSNRKIKQVR